MSIKKGMKSLFAHEEPQTAAPAELTVSEISKDLVATLAKLDARASVLDGKVAAAEAAVIAATEAKRKALGEKSEAASLSKKINELINPTATPPTVALAAPAPQLVAPAVQPAAAPQTKLDTAAPARPNGV